MRRGFLGGGGSDIQSVLNLQVQNVLQAVCVLNRWWRTVSLGCWKWDNAMWRTCQLHMSAALCNLKWLAPYVTFLLLNISCVIRHFWIEVQKWFAKFAILAIGNNITVAYCSLLAVSGLFKKKKRREVNLMSSLQWNWGVDWFNFGLWWKIKGIFFTEFVNTSPHTHKLYLSSSFGLLV